MNRLLDIAADCSRSAGLNNCLSLLSIFVGAVNRGPPLTALLTALKTVSLHGKFVKVQKCFCKNESHETYQR